MAMPPLERASKLTCRSERTSPPARPASPRPALVSTAAGISLFRPHLKFGDDGVGHLRGGGCALPERLRAAGHAQHVVSADLAFGDHRRNRIANPAGLFP